MVLLLNSFTEENLHTIKYTDFMETQRDFPDWESNPGRGGESTKSYPLDHQGLKIHWF